MARRSRIDPNDKSFLNNPIWQGASPEPPRPWFVYKVVRVKPHSDQERYFSSKVCESVAIEYRIGERMDFVTPVFVFKKLGHAMVHARLVAKQCPMAVFHCQTFFYYSFKVTSIVPSPTCLLFERFGGPEGFWKNAIKDDVTIDHQWSAADFVKRGVLSPATFYGTDVTAPIPGMCYEEPREFCCYDLELAEEVDRVEP